MLHPGLIDLSQELHKSRANDIVYVQNLTDNDKWLSNGRTYFSVLGQLNCSFGCEKGLYWSILAATDPLEKCILQKRGEKWFIIHSLDSLIGHVEIRSAEAALNYCRLKTALRWANIAVPTKDRFYEIVPTTSISAGIHYGLKGFDSPHNGFLGYVTDSWFSLNRLSTPKMVKTKTGWEIHRSCFFTDGMYETNSRPIWTTETVTTDGRYTFRSSPLRLRYKPNVLSGSGPQE